MCFPQLGMVATLAGGAMQAMSALGQAETQSAEYKARAAYDVRQATIERVKGAYEANKMRDAGARVFGKQRALFTERGVESEGGSATDVVFDSIAENELDISAVKWGQEIAAQNYDYEAKINTMNAKTAKQSGMMAALSPILGSFTKVASNYG